MESLPTEEWTQQILNFVSVLKGKSGDEVKDLYLKHVKGWPLYGVTLFNVKVGSPLSL